MTRHPLKIATIAAAIALLYFPNAETKCARARYAISGTVKDCETGNPIAGAHVVLFVDDEPSARPDTNSDFQGSYSGEFYFDTYSGIALIPIDRCNRRPRIITIVSTAPGYISSRSNVARRNIPRLDDNLQAHLGLAPIYLARADGKPCSRGTT